ncbi:MAG: GrpB family protein [Duncaniella sp.]|uniref:GrpB family protein n=1 Tax=Duncaniella sp. TaxID=2518496 RepID=UPI0023D14B27|nr:GrpB family protein [Duncaniella sp.]MDE6089762.1 GrpB family protein [Duncaniella sp.]
MYRRKELNEMSLEELWELFPIIITPHRPEWEKWAEDEIRIITDMLSVFSPTVTHIGSTAIPRIPAKPIIDILVEISDNNDFITIKRIMERNGYICMSLSEKRMSFNKGYTPDGFAEKVYHVHIRTAGDNDEIYFRNYLREHPEAAHQYGLLKQSLLPKYKHDRDGYTEAKSEFVRKITEIAKRVDGDTL